jgi:hypothetical protein
MRFVLRSPAAKFLGGKRKEPVVTPDPENSLREHPHAASLKREQIPAVKPKRMPAILLIGEILGLVGGATPLIGTIAKLFGAGNKKIQGSALLRMEEARLKNKTEAVYALLQHPDLPEESHDMLLALYRVDVMQALAMMDTVADLLDGQDDDEPK